MIRHARAPVLRKLGALSPSSAITLTTCKLRLAFSLDSDRDQRPPTTVSQAIGMVVHGMVAQVRRGDLAIVPDEEIEQKLADEWARQIAVYHARIQADCIAGEASPPDRWRGYALTRARLLKYLSRLEHDIRASPRLGNGPLVERQFSSPDGDLQGRIDRVEQGPDGAHIIDVKTSRSETPEILPTHRQQLLIYSVLWQRVTGEWPARASIEHLGFGRHTIDIDPLEAQALIDDLLRQRDKFNQLVVQATQPNDLASPSSETCRYCNYRGACIPFLREVREDWGWFLRTMLGRVDEVVPSRDSCDVALDIAGGNMPAGVQKAHIKGFHLDAAPPVGTWVTVVDAHPTSAPNVLQAMCETELWTWSTDHASTIISNAAIESP